MFCVVELVLSVCGLWLNLMCLLQVVMNLRSRVCRNVAVDKKPLSICHAQSINLQFLSIFIASIYKKGFVLLLHSVCNTVYIKRSAGKLERAWRTEHAVPSKTCKENEWHDFSGLLCFPSEVLWSSDYHQPFYNKHSFVFFEVVWSEQSPTD